MKTNTLVLALLASMLIAPQALASVLDPPPQPKITDLSTESALPEKGVGTYQIQPTGGATFLLNTSTGETWTWNSKIGEWIRVKNPTNIVREVK